MGKLYRAGEVARLLGVEEDTLRYYESCGIVVPTRRDEERNFSLYDQQSILHLWQNMVMRDAGMSIGDIQAVEHQRDLEKQIAALEYRLRSVRSVLAMLRQIEQKENRYRIVETSIPAGSYLRYRLVAPTTRAIFGAFLELFDRAVRQGLEIDRSRPPFCCFPDIEFRVKDIPCEAYLPVVGSVLNEDVVRVEVPNAIATVHHGTYRDVEYAYNALEEYVSENDVEVIGSPLEMYVFGLNDPEQKNLTTTVLFPIAKY